MQVSEFIDGILSTLLGLFSFEVFISPYLIILVYYLGAVIFPLYIYRFVRRHYKKVSDLNLPKVELDPSITVLKFSPKWLFLLGFVVFEIFWRMFFEFFVAYFQIRDALMSMS